jgi:hypothetical protein
MMKIKELNLKILMKRTLLGIVATSLIFTACDNEEDMTPEMPTGSITVSDQALVGNTISVDDVTLNQSGWVVVHASNDAGDGPQVPEIISEPLLLESGMNSDVEVTLTNPDEIEDGDQVWVMLHTDDGEVGVYEFDGASEFDGPILNDDGSIVVKPLTLTVEAPAPTGSFTANDQEVVGSTINVETITVGQPSWVVVHADDGTGNGPQAPEIISEPVALEVGTSNDVEITLTESVSDGDRLWVMLHNDNGIVGEYEFDGSNGLDNPITFSSIDVTVAAATNYDVVNDGASAYLFTGDGLTNDSNPDITLVRGETYTFTVNASGHPFYINDTQGTGTSNAYNNGVTNNGAQSGTVTFTVPNDAPNTLFYNCEFHSSMTGTFTITD